MQQTSSFLLSYPSSEALDHAVVRVAHDAQLMRPLNIEMVIEVAPLDGGKSVNYEQQVFRLGSRLMKRQEKRKGGKRDERDDEDEHRLHQIAAHLAQERHRRAGDGKAEHGRGIEGHAQTAVHDGKPSLGRPGCGGCPRGRRGHYSVFRLCLSNIT